MADTHFGRERIIQYCYRPYGTVQEMDEDLARRWNTTVGTDDTVYHLGDFTLGGPEPAQRYLAGLNGHVRLVPGGHDERWARPDRAYHTRSGPVELLPPLVGH